MVHTHGVFIVLPHWNASWYPSQSLTRPWTSQSGPHPLFKCLSLILSKLKHLFRVYTTYAPYILLYLLGICCAIWGTGRSSGGRALSCKGLKPPAWWIDPAWQMHLLSGLFSVPTSGLQLGHQRLSCLWDSAYKRLLPTYRKRCQIADVMKINVL